jgi:hypothetical protein
LGRRNPLIRASVEDAQRINDWVWRDSGNRPDFTAFLSDRLNVCLIEGEGGALFVWRGPGIYEVHVFFEQRGKEVIRLSRQMLDYMRENGARLFWAAVPVESRTSSCSPASWAGNHRALATSRKAAANFSSENRMPPAVAPPASSRRERSAVPSLADRRRRKPRPKPMPRSTGDQAQLQLGRESMGLNKDIYNSNYSLLSPFVSRGNVAGESINALLGILARSPATSDQYPLYQSYLGSHPQPQAGTPQTTPEAGTTTPASTPVTGVSATDAMHNFANSAGMQFQLQQGENAINNGYAAKGQLQSGAAMKALQSFGQNTALNNYFMPYMGLLGGQQATGAGAASSIAGVGANFGNTAANINAGMGQNIQSGANSASNAALLRGQATSNMWSGVGSALGGLASSFAPTTG